jgi:hypothetical protein
LQPEGWLLLTTPNVASWHGRWKFFTLGQLRGFDERNFCYQRHITPLTHAQIRPMLEELGFDLIGRTTAGEFYGWMKLLLLSPLWLPFRVLGTRELWGDVALYVCRLKSK